MEKRLTIGLDTQRETLADFKGDGCIDDIVTALGRHIRSRFNCENDDLLEFHGPLILADILRETLLTYEEEADDVMDAVRADSVDGFISRWNREVAAYDYEDHFTLAVQNG